MVNELDCGFVEALKGRFAEQMSGADFYADDDLILDRRL